MQMEDWWKGTKLQVIDWRNTFHCSVWVVGWLWLIISYWKFQSCTRFLNVWGTLVFPFSKTSRLLLEQSRETKHKWFEAVYGEWCWIKGSQWSLGIWDKEPDKNWRKWFWNCREVKTKSFPKLSVKKICSWTDFQLLVLYESCPFAMLPLVLRTPSVWKPSNIPVGELLGVLALDTYLPLIVVAPVRDVIAS